MTDSTPAAARSYWYHRPEDGFPPRPTASPQEYAGGPHLHLGGIAGGRSVREQREWLRRWCEALPSLHEVRTLWLTTRVPQALFEAACALPALDGLSLKSSALVSLE